MTCGIYLIRNEVSGLCYVGQSSDITQRWHGHRCILRGRTTGSVLKRVNNHLAHAWRKYGESTFKFSVLEICDEADLTAFEAEWLDTLRAIYGRKKIANSSGPSDNPMRGRKHTDKALAKISAAFKGIPKSVEHRRKIGDAHRGRVKSESHRQNLSASKIGCSIPSLRGQRNPSCRPEQVLRMKTNNPVNMPGIKQIISQKQSKPVVDLVSGETWPSASACAEQLGVSVASVSYNALGIHKSCRGRKLAYV